jgi:hypothetical protein
MVQIPDERAKLTLRLHRALAGGEAGRASRGGLLGFTASASLQPEPLGERHGEAVDRVAALRAVDRDNSGRAIGS